MRDKYGVAHDSYWYPGSDVLVNLLNIRDADELAEAEAGVTAERYRTYESRQLSLADFSFETCNTEKQWLLDKKNGEQKAYTRRITC